jgi:hypothetical protein
MQFKLFAKHVGNCHSWYKHIPLIDGADFIVFLDEDAGIGYPSLHPELPYGNSTEQYREAFGILNYAWMANSGGLWCRDGKSIIDLGDLQLPEYIKTQCRFTLFPVVSGGEFEEAYSIHENDLKRISNGTYHPYAMQLLEWERYYLEKNHLWQTLTGEECDVLSSMDCCFDAKDITNSMKKYLDAEENGYRIIELLCHEEEKKIEVALSNLEIFFTNL